MKDPLQDVMEERSRQDRIWGVGDHGDLYWLGILMEEVGEVATACIGDDASDRKTEVTQVAAVAIAWLDCMARRSDVFEKENDNA